MKNKLPFTIRLIFVVALLMLTAGLLTTTNVQSADPYDPTLIVEKTVINDNGGTVTDPDAFLLKVNGVSVLSGDSNPYEPGTYTVTETLLPGYAASDWGTDCAIDGTITLVQYQNKTCTITNDDIAPSLTVIKNVVNNNGGLLGASDFTINVTGTDVSLPSFPGAESPGTTVTLDAGSYSVGEINVDGYNDSYSPDCSGTIGIGETRTCTITNNDVGFNITPTTPLVTSENGLQDTFDVVLDTPPVGNVVLTLSSPPPDEGTIDKTSLTFTPSTWSNPQTVTIIGVDDFIADGDQDYTIITGLGPYPTSCQDPDYCLLDPIADIPDILVTNIDDETPGFTVTPNTDLWVSEGGKTEAIEVWLKSRPTSQVTINAQSSDTNEGTVSIENAVVNPLVWPQTTPTKITVTGIDDCTSGGGSLTVTINAISDDTNYNGTVAVLPVTNYDAPTIGWVKPVETEETYDSDGVAPINLEVVSLCPEPIQKVRFYRWSTILGANVTIFEDPTLPYRVVLPADELEDGYNQIRAFAFSPTDPQTFSKHELIYITNGFPVFLPLVKR